MQCLWLFFYPEINYFNTVIIGSTFVYTLSINCHQNGKFQVNLHITSDMNQKRFQNYIDRLTRQGFVVQFRPLAIGRTVKSICSWSSIHSLFCCKIPSFLCLDFYPLAIHKNYSSCNMKSLASKKCSIPAYK